MTRGSFVVKIDATQLEGVAQALGRLDAATLGQASLTAVNTVAEPAYKDARAKMNAGINLPDSYLQERMAFEPATDPLMPVAVILARRRATTLGRYGAVQLTQVVKYPNDLFTPGKMGVNPRKPGSPLPWKLRTGDPSRSIPVDRKQAGVSVEVTRGSRKAISYAFVIHKNGVNLLVERVKGTRRKVEALYGPSVYQLFRAALSDDFLAQVTERLGKTVVTLTEEELRKALA